MDDDIAPALDLAWRMFVKYDSIDYGVEHTERMREAIVLQKLLSGVKPLSSYLFQEK